MTSTPSRTASVVSAGAVCLAILGGMLVMHAWPLWTGRVIVLPATFVGQGEPHAGGQYVRLSTPAATLLLDDMPEGDAAAGVRVRTVGPGWDERPVRAGWARDLRGRVVYVQFEPGSDGVSAPVSVAFEPVAGATNLRGRVDMNLASSRASAAGRRLLPVDYGLDAYFLPVRGAIAAADGLGNSGALKMQVAVATSGHARISGLIAGDRRW